MFQVPTKGGECRYDLAEFVNLIKAGKHQMDTCMIVL
jgi:hypothetical protein